MGLHKDIDIWNLKVDRCGKPLIKLHHWNDRFARVGCYIPNPDLIALGIGTIYTDFTNKPCIDFAGIMITKPAAIELAKRLFEAAGVEPEEF